MSDVDIHHLAAAYALDALDEHERQEFESHYPSCDVCRADVVAFRRTMAEVAAASAVAPPPSLKAAVLAEVATTRQLSPVVPSAAPNVVRLAERRSARTAWWAAAAAAVLLIGVVATFAVRGGEADPYEAAVARVMEQPDAEVLQLAAADGVSGTFKVMWSEQLGEAVLIGEGLPAAPDGKGYELWWFPTAGDSAAPSSPNEDGRLAMFVLDPADDGDVHHVMDLPSTPAAWAITMEPETGAPVTTGEVIFIAEA